MAEATNCDSKVWWKSKTQWVNIILAVLWALSIIEGFTDNKVYLAVLALVTVVLNIALRWLTGGPITLKDLQAIADEAKELQKTVNNPGWSASDGTGDSHGALTIEFHGGKKDGE